MSRMTPEQQAARRALIEEAKQRYRLSDIIGRKTKLKRAGREMVGLCFAHQEKTPSLYVNDDLGVYLCRGCNVSGDLIKAVMEIENVDFNGALRWLGATELPVVDPAERIKAIAREDADRDLRMDAAAEVWKASVALSGTLGEVYLGSRGITSWHHTIHFARTWAWCNFDTGETGPDMPALIGYVVDGAGDFSGIQRIFLRPDGSGKASMDRPKLSLGRVKGGALRLGPPAPEILICEGPEDGLALAQERPGSSVWVSLGTANMSAIRYPEIVQKIVICAQNDGAADRATDEAAMNLRDQGYIVDVRHPDPRFKDWNDQLMGREL